MRRLRLEVKTFFEGFQLSAHQHPAFGLDHRFLGSSIDCESDLITDCIESTRQLNFELFWSPGFNSKLKSQRFPSVPDKIHEVQASIVESRFKPLRNKVTKKGHHIQEGCLSTGIG